MILSLDRFKFLDYPISYHWINIRVAPDFPFINFLCQFEKTLSPQVLIVEILSRLQAILLLLNVLFDGRRTINKPLYSQQFWIVHDSSTCTAFICDHMAHRDHKSSAYTLNLLFDKMLAAALIIPYLPDIPSLPENKDGLVLSESRRID